MRQVTLLALNMDDKDMGLICTLSYLFLFRVQSEMIPLEAGVESELAAGLAQHRHSSACVKDGRLHIRLKSRKHRPQGSLLIRGCVCSHTLDARLCPVHCIDWSTMEVGEKLLQITPTAAQQRLRRYSLLCGIPGASQVTLKVFRASRATTVALAGKPLHAIMHAGEWKSEAAQRYCSADAFDLGAMVSSVIQEDAVDDEDSE